MGTLHNPTWSILASVSNCQQQFLQKGSRRRRGAEKAGRARLRNRFIALKAIGAFWTAMAAGGVFAQAPRVVVFEQPGFPTVESDPVPRAVLQAALGPSVTFADLQQLRRPGAPLESASLLVLPYGSAIPPAAWDRMESFLHAGGSLLLLGGEPGRVPIEGDTPGAFRALAPQDSYSRALGFKHSYPVPLKGSLGSGQARFTWRTGYSFLPAVSVRAEAVFAQEGRLDGLGYLDALDGTHLAAPVIVADRENGSRIVALPFTPAPGYWASPDGVTLLRAAAAYAAAGARHFSLETHYAALRPNEPPELTAHLRGGSGGVLRAELMQGATVLDKAELPAQPDTPLPFSKPIPPGQYTVRATWTPPNNPGEYTENGFVVEPANALANGPSLTAHGDFLALDGKPFLPVGTNYFTTEENGWDFSGPRNNAVWERDFADMERHGVNWVRTGVWMGQNKTLNPTTGQAGERFLRNVEAYLAAAHRHGIAVNFTFFAFSPSVHEKSNDPEPNPYLDPSTVHAEQTWILSIVRRFHDIPWLSWDLINEPSFSNPKTIFHGNLPNNDPAELAAWQSWLRKHYSTLPALADAWRVTPDELAAWERIPLPKAADLAYDRYGNADEVRALDYNLFAQDTFAQWTRGMVAAIRSTGSTQLVDVGQDEGGVTDRVLNQFYATAGVGFTTNHTYWQDAALLWDSVVAKRPGLPNITGETGYQPAWNPDGVWRYDELTGTALLERKLALGFAAGSSGAVQWDWAREPDFGIERSDGSAKVWKAMLGELGRFATAAAPSFTGLTPPEVAVILPQSLQLSVLKAQALQAQQTAVRVLYNYNRVEAYAVGEYQTDTLGSPKLILLPSAYNLDEKAWAALEARVRSGATLLLSGPFSADPHGHPTDRAKNIGLPYTLAPLQQREEILGSPSGELPLTYGGQQTTVLDRAVLPNSATWAELPLGRGRVLFSALPLELNDNLQRVAEVYAYALAKAGVHRTYTTPLVNPGILICPTRLPHATLYVLSSETQTMPVSFRDARSRKTFSGALEAGRAALLLVGENGTLLAGYGWSGTQ